MAAYKAVSQTTKRRPYGRWSYAQDETLRSGFSGKDFTNVRALARQLGRSEHAVRCRASKLGLTRGPITDGHYTLSDLASNLRVRKERVRQWAREGLLVGTQHPFTREWTFTSGQVAAFLHDHPGEATRPFGDHVLWLIGMLMSYDDLQPGPNRRGKAGAA